MSDAKTGHARLQEAFPASQIQKLPQGGLQLDYVSHGNVTKRLLEVDPEWNWEPLAYDEQGLPQFDEHGGLWIKLTVLGITRLGYGEPQGRDDYDKTKSTIGNAIKTAAMRFGVALDLWAKDVPHEAPAPRTKSTKMPRVTSTMGRSFEVDQISDAQVKLINALTNGDLTVVDGWKESKGIDRKLTKREGVELIDWLKEQGFQPISRKPIQADIEVDPWAEEQA